jgi:hypothetical protein
MVECARQFKSGDHVRIVTSDPRNIVLNGRLGWVMPAEAGELGQTWAYWVDLFPPLERTWLLREDELERVDD